MLPVRRITEENKKIGDLTWPWLTPKAYFFPVTFKQLYRSIFYFLGASILRTVRVEVVIDVPFKRHLKPQIMLSKEQLLGAWSHTCELNLKPHPSTIQRKGLVPACASTCLSSHDLEHDVLPCTLQPIQRHTYCSWVACDITCFTCTKRIRWRTSFGLLYTGFISKSNTQWKLNCAFHHTLILTTLHELVKWFIMIIRIKYKL